MRHEIVHNKHVVEALKAKGARFVEELSEVPPNAVTIFSAHGVAKSVEDEAASADLPVLERDLSAGDQGPQSGQALLSAQGRKLILIGHAGHPRSRARWGRSPSPVILVQTEEDVDALDLPDRHAGRLCHADDAQRRRHPGHHRGAAAHVHRYRRPRHARHLLRDAEPPDRGARALPSSST